MCGHVGMAGPNMGTREYESRLEDGLQICSLRGRDSVGIGVVPVDRSKREPYAIKRLGAPPFFFTLPNGGAKVLIGHCRSATIGGRDDLSIAHPFHFDNIIGAHNGTLTDNWREELQWGTNEVFGSDSQAVFYNFAYYGVEETVKRIRGAWCFIWWDDDEQTLNMLRNSQRPLWLAKGKDGVLYWASEYWMIQGMVRAGERDRTKFEKNDNGRYFSELPINQWRRYKITDTEVVQLDDIPLSGALPRPVVVSSTNTRPPHAGGTIWQNDNFILNSGKTSSTGGTTELEWRYLAWDGPTKDWKEVDEAYPGAMRVPVFRNKVATLEVKAKGGKLWRNVAGTAYVCAVGGNEITFRELLEFRTDGACMSCGTDIVDPKQIGYLPTDYSFVVCEDCCKDWFDQEWAEMCFAEESDKVAEDKDDDDDDDADDTILDEHDENVNRILSIVASNRREAGDLDDDIPFDPILGKKGPPDLETPALFLDVQALELPFEEDTGKIDKAVVPPKISLPSSRVVMSGTRWDWWNDPSRNTIRRN